MGFWKREEVRISMEWRIMKIIWWKASWELVRFDRVVLSESFDWSKSTIKIPFLNGQVVAGCLNGKPVKPFVYSVFVMVNAGPGRSLDLVVEDERQGLFLKRIVQVIENLIGE